MTTTPSDRRTATTLLNVAVAVHLLTLCFYLGLVAISAGLS